MWSHLWAGSQDNASTPSPPRTTQNTPNLGNHPEDPVHRLCFFLATHAFIATRDRPLHCAAAAQEMQGAVPTSGLAANAETPDETAPTATLGIGAVTDTLMGPLPYHLLAMANSAFLLYHWPHQQPHLRNSLPAQLGCAPTVP